MNDIKNVLICGLGAIGTVYAAKLDGTNFDLRVLVDAQRYEKYSHNPIIYNGKPLSLTYIFPNEKDFTADLILIATKMSGLADVLTKIKSFVSGDTVILSLINGISSEKIIAESYDAKNVLYSYFIGHSSVRKENLVTHDGVNKIVFGSNNKDDINSIKRVKKFFDTANINYEISDDIIHSLWLKFMLNVSSNPTTALFRMTFGEMLNNSAMMKMAVNVMKEVQAIAKAEGVNNTDVLIEEALENIKTMSKDGKTSMLQDIEAGRKTESDIFVGTIVKLGEKHNISTPYCKFLQEAFDVLHEQIDKELQL
jgi:2-dehydropantoate 2-reductase